MYSSKATIIALAIVLALLEVAHAQQGTAITIEPMNDILTKAKEYRELVATRAIAHEKSAEHHRARGVRIGILATVLSVLVGTGIFVAVTNQLGLDGQRGISLPKGWWPLIMYFVFGLLMILAPVFTGVNTYLNDPQQAEKHKISSDGYFLVQLHIDRFLLRYADVNSAAAKREEALKELEDISKEIGTVSDKSLTLTKEAYAAAAAEAPGRGNNKP